MNQIVEQPRRPASRDGLMLWIIHKFATVFRDHAILKGGMALRLLESERATNDVDLVCIPFRSKKDILPQVRALLNDLRDATVDVAVHSTMIRADIQLDDAAIQVEISVAEHCDSTPITTASLARAVSTTPQVVRIMAVDVALAHKLAAWNERRLHRDLYDAWFLWTRGQQAPNAAVLKTRLSAIRSRLPSLRRTTTMTLEKFRAELEAALASVTDQELLQELGGVLPETELMGLAIRLRAGLLRMSLE